MKPILMTLLISAAVLAACSAPVADAPAAEEPAAWLPAIEQELEAASSDIQGYSPAEAAAAVAGEDCPICDLDYAAYSGPLSEAEVQGLLLALNDEYRAWAIYEQVLLDFGADTRPFVNIKESEAAHIERLVALFETYEVAVPANPWIGNAPQFASPTEACAAGVGAEIDNAALYDKLFSSTEREDILLVYQALQRASLDNHLPAFENCGGGSNTGGRGRVGKQGGKW